MNINTNPNLDAPDDFYEMLVEAHRALSPDQSRLVNAKLILLLANHIGNTTVLSEAIALAKAGVERTAVEDDLRVTA